MKKGVSCDDALAEAEQLRAGIGRFGEELAQCERQREEQIRLLGNAVDDSVPVSQNEDDDNLVICVWPTPLGLLLPCRLADISYQSPEARPLTHDELLWRIGGYDPVRGSKVAGNRGYFLKGVGVLLNQALINFAVEFLRRREYEPIQVPLFMKKDLMAGIAQLGDFHEQLYKVSTGTAAAADDVDGAGEKYLIATSEQPLCALHAKEELDTVPIRYAGVSTCFRKEAGKANRDNRGIFRVHQFEKVEQFCITAGNIDASKNMHQEMLQCAKEFHEALGIPYRVVNIVSGELNDAAVMKYDLEGWFPANGKYRELVSCSNCTDFQSRALGVRHRSHKVELVNGTKKSTVELSHVHMLNSTLTATGRAICCILENYQTADGVRVPDVLVPYMPDGMNFLKFVQEYVDPAGTSVAAPKAKGVHAAPASVTAAVEQPTVFQPSCENAPTQLQALEAQLQDYPYVGGFRPSEADVTAYQAVAGVHVDAGRFPNVTRWMKHVNSFTTRDRALWR